jgi:hypothetical protein
MSASDELRAHLLVIADHIREAIVLLDNGATPAASLHLPTGSQACTHKDSKALMGGYRVCLNQECGYRWRDS